MTKELAEPQEGCLGGAGNWAAAGEVGKGDAGLKRERRRRNHKARHRRLKGKPQVSLCGIPSIVFP